MDNELSEVKKLKKETIIPIKEQKSDKTMPGIKIRSAFCHKAILVPGAILSETSLNQAKVPGIQMSYHPDGLFVRARGITTIVPLSNVANAIVDEA